MYNFLVRIKSISFTLCPLPSHVSVKKDYFFEAGLAAAFMRGMSMKSLLYCFSPHDGAEDKPPPGQHEN